MSSAVIPVGSIGKKWNDPNHSLFLNLTIAVGRRKLAADTTGLAMRRMKIRPCTGRKQTWSADNNDRPSKRGLRHRRSPFCWRLAGSGKRFPDAAKGFMVPPSLLL
jgi:hypothetical protein